MRGNISGMCIPHYVIDLPGGGGKVPLLPESLLGIEGDDLLIKNYQGKIFKYRVEAEDKKIFKIMN
jgi:lysine 2,3-aminomutase